MPLPPGFELEQSQQPKLPPGFEIERAPKKRGFLPERNLTPQARAALEDMQARPWGSGTPHIAYGAGEKVSDFATGMGASPEVSAGLGYGANVATQAIPALMSSYGLQKTASPVLQEGARGLMGMALKPSATAKMSGKADRAIDTMLEHGYNPSTSGAEKMWSKVGELNKQVDEKISNSSAAIESDKVTKYLADALKKFEARPNAVQAAKEIEEAGKQFSGHPLIQSAERYSANEIPVQAAQRLKQGYQASVGDKGYGELKTVATEAEKAIARGLREEISAAVPGVSDLNKLESELINAAKLAGRRGATSGNSNPLSLGATIGAATQNPAATLGLWANSSSWAKAMLARMLYSGSERIPQAAGGAAGAALMAPTGKAPTEQELMAEQLRKRKKLPPMYEPMMSPEDASIPIAQR